MEHLGLLILGPTKKSGVPQVPILGVQHHFVGGYITILLIHSHFGSTINTSTTSICHG
jgi:hypothetical protein